jgi:hypothetical protein
MSHEDLKKAEDTTVKTGSGVPNLIRVEGSGASTDMQKAETMREPKGKAQKAVKKAFRNGLAKEVSEEVNKEVADGLTHVVRKEVMKEDEEDEEEEENKEDDDDDDDDQVEDACPQLIYWRSA